MNAAAKSSTLLGSYKKAEWEEFENVEAIEELW